MAKNTIVIKAFNEPVRDEYISTAVAITPGMLLEPVAAGTIQAHSTSEGNAIPMFAVEDDLQGNDIDDNYEVSSRIQVWVPRRGDEVYGLLANGETIVIGDFLSSNGDGYLKLHVADDSGGIQTNAIVAQALEAVDMSDSSAADPSGRIEVRII